MPKTVLVLNNPASVLILFTKLREGVDEIWIETGVSSKLDNGIARVLSILGIDEELPMHRVKVENLFEAGRAGRNKVKRYREIAAQVTSLCAEKGVKNLICSTTSSFRLANVEKLQIVDHGTGDYLRSPMKTRIERFKYSTLYAPRGRRSFSYHAIVALPGRTYLRIDTVQVRARLAGVSHPFSPERVSVLMLVDPRPAVEEQLSRLHSLMGDTPYDVYLKSHHFDPKSRQVDTAEIANLPTPRQLPEVLAVLPAELIFFGIDAQINVVAFDSSALWNLGASHKESVFSIAKRSEILEFPNFSPAGLDWLENAIGYAPFR